MNGFRLSCLIRKTLPRVSLIFILSLANNSFAVELTTLASNNQERYWYDGNIKKYISTTSDEVAIIHNDRGSVSKNAQLEMLRASEPGMSVLSEFDNNITRFTVPDINNTYRLSNKIEELRQRQLIKTISPVFRQNIWSRDNWQLLSGELIIHFRPEWNESEIVEWLDDRNLGVIEVFSFAKNAYRVKQNDETRDSLEVANEIYESGEVTFSYPNWIKKRVAKTKPNDALFNDQWHLMNAGQSGGAPFEDINVLDIWDSYKGSSNEVVAIVDDGLEVNHEDLIQNIIPGLSYDFVDSDDDPTANDHGTSVAGLVAARGNNAIGISGVAPEAGIVGYRILPITTDVSEASALSKNTQIIDIFNNSWGPPDTGFILEGPGVLTKAALENGVMTGRGGAGSIYVWSVGNGAELNDNGNYDGYANSRYTIAVGATTDQGTESAYSEPCACLIISAPSDGGTAAIVTTDRTGANGYEAGNYTSTFGGTSASAPIVSGVIALMLQANPDLTWRDVQKVLALSANQIDPTDNDWITNGAGYPVNHKFGFGRVDAEAAVRMAEHWLSAGPEIVIEKNANPQISIPDNNSTGVSDSINVPQALVIEYVEVTFSSTDHTFRGDLQIELVSPDGTSSILGTPRVDPGRGYNQWTFGSARHLHELSAGTWTLKVADEFSEDTGTFESWSLKIYGNNNSDGDNISNNADPDDDNDGLPDTYEMANGLDPFNGYDIHGDVDGDGYTNNTEYLAGTAISNAGDFPASSIPYLIDDISSLSSLSSIPNTFFYAGNIVYFIAEDAEHGNSLWKTDGTESGTVLLKPGFSFRYAANTDDLTFFSIGDLLWKSDGTVTGTQLVVDCWPGGNNGGSDPIMAVNNLVFFWCSGDEGKGLWVSDGTPEGSRRLFDPAPSIFGGSRISSMKDFNGLLVFSAESESKGGELWRSAGTPDGTEIIKDIVPGTGGSLPGDITVMGNKFFFVANFGNTGRELWISDGTEAGTVLVKDILPGSAHSSIENLVLFNNRLFFTAESAAGNELWVSDGTESGTHMVKDIRPGGPDSNPSNVTVFDGRLYFTARDTSSGIELWSSDGTEAGTYMVKDILSGDSSSSPSRLTVSGNTLFFLADDGLTGRELWKTDGTGAGTVLVKDIKTGPNANIYENITSLNGKLIFRADDGVTGSELWLSDGTAAGTVLLKDIVPGSGSSNAFLHTTIDNLLLITANDGTIGQELWVSDGTPSGTQVLKDINDTTESSDIRKIIGFNNNLYIQIESELWKSDGLIGDAVQLNTTVDFYADKFIIFNNDLYYAGGGNRSLWRINGATGLPELVKDFPAGEINIYSSAVFNGRLYFAATEFDPSEKLWATDGTQVGTQQVNDISFYSSPKFVVLGNYMYFAGNDDAYGVELWKTDGTDSGTVLVKDIFPGSSSSFPGDLTVYNNELYFSANSTHSFYRGIWKSDGTASGTVVVKEGNVIFTAQDNFIVMGDQLYFKTPGGLWKTDGTGAGTHLIRAVEAWGHGDMIGYNDILYFSANNNQHGVELWRSDGTAYGTYLLKDINNQVNPLDSSFPNDFLVAAGRLYFTATQHTSDASESKQLWSTDGTSENTKKLTHLVPGLRFHLTHLNNTLYFSAYTYPYGNEVHAISLDADGDGIANISDNCPLDPDVLNVNTDHDALCNTLDTNDDNDGMPDSYEIANGLRPLVNDSYGDRDSDGLTNLDEYLLGTSVNTFDTDNDGMSDSYEVDNLLNPLNDDSFEDRDADGLTNIEEYLRGTSADDPDTDHDGIKDKIEIQNGSNPLGAETDLKITSTVNTQFPTPGSPVEFQIKVTNDGPLAATNIVVKDLLPKGMKVTVGMAPFVSQGTYDPVTGSWHIGSLLGGRTAVLTLPATPIQYQLRECFVNSVSLTEFTANDINKNNNRAISTVYVGGASSCAQLKYSVSPGTISIQQCTGTNQFDVNVAIENTGPNVARNVNINFTGSYKTLSVVGSSPIIDQIPPGGKVDTKVGLSVPCGQTPAVASYTLAITSDTLLSTDSVINGIGTVNVPDTGICSCVTPVQPAIDTSTSGNASGNTSSANGDSSASGGGGGGGGCFIATAAYGSYLHPYVVELRLFRDNFLEKSLLGREFISLYYKYSPPLANVIAGHESMRFFARLLLTPVVFIIAYPILVLLILIIFALVLLLKLERSRVRLIL